MVSFLFIRTFLFITILTTCCTASISIEVVQGETDKMIENKDGNNKALFCASISERAVIVNRKLKCVSQSEIITTVKATDKIQETDSKCFAFGKFYQKISNKLFHSNFEFFIRW